MKFRLLKERLNKTESVNKSGFPLLRESKEDQERFAIFLNDEKLADEFFKRKKNFPYPQNDYIYWMKIIKDKNQLKDFMDKATKTDRFWKAANEYIESDWADDVEIVSKQDGYTIYKINTPEASVKYGLFVGGKAQWCISGAFWEEADGNIEWSFAEDVEENWDHYTMDDDSVFFSIMDNSNKDSPKKWALVVNPDWEELDLTYPEAVYGIWDVRDKDVLEIPGLGDVYYNGSLIYPSGGLTGKNKQNWKDNFFESSSLKESGYSDHSMSNNAVSAYENGEKPLSKWTKQDILSEIKQLYPNFFEIAKSLPVYSLKDIFLVKSSWHHTSKYYNRTDFYSVRDDLDLTEDELLSMANSVIKPKREVNYEPKRYLADVEYIEWVGTKRHPKPNKIVLKDVFVEDSGDWRIVYDKNGNKLLRKNYYTNGFKVVKK